MYLQYLFGENEQDLFLPLCARPVKALPLTLSVIDCTSNLFLFAKGGATVDVCVFIGGGVACVCIAA